MPLSSIIHWVAAFIILSSAVRLIMGFSIDPVEIMIYYFATSTLADIIGAFEEAGQNDE